MTHRFKVGQQVVAKHKLETCYGLDKPIEINAEAGDVGEILCVDPAGNGDEKLYLAYFYGHSHSTDVHEDSLSEVAQS